MLCYFIFDHQLILPNRDQATSTDNSAGHQPLDFATDVSLRTAKVRQLINTYIGSSAFEGQADLGSR